MDYINEKLGAYTHNLSEQTVKEHFTDLIKVYNSLTFILTNLSDDFGGIQFVEYPSGVYPSTIRIHLYSKSLSDLTDETYPLTAENFLSFNLDFSNVTKAIDESIEFWQDSDNEDYINYLVGDYFYEQDDYNDYDYDDWWDI